MTLSPIASFRKRKNKNPGFSATFLRLRIVAGLSNVENIAKAQQIDCLAAHFRLLKTGEDPQSKKSCRKAGIFVFKTSGQVQQGDCRTGPHLQRMCEARSAATAATAATAAAAMATACQPAARQLPDPIPPPAALAPACGCRAATAPSARARQLPDPDPPQPAAPAPVCGR